MRPDSEKRTVGWSELTAARWFRVLAWIVGSLVGLIALLYGWGFYLANIEPRFAPHGPYNIVGFNYTDRPIDTFRVNRTGGGNVFAGSSGGGGGFTCCIDIDRSAKTVEVRWEWGYTGPQLAERFPNFVRGQGNPVPFDAIETVAELPDLPDGSHGYLGVHFFPNHVVKITYSARIPRLFKRSNRR